MIDPKQNFQFLPVTVTGTNRVSHKPGQRKCQKFMLIILTCNYLTGHG